MSTTPHLISLFSNNLKSARTVMIYSQFKVNIPLYSFCSSDFFSFLRCRSQFENSRGNTTQSRFFYTISPNIILCYHMAWPALCTQYNRSEQGWTGECKPVWKEKYSFAFKLLFCFLSQEEKGKVFTIIESV